MATIPEEISNRIWLNCQELINIINSAKSAEYILFIRHGETENTINDLDTLQNIAEEATNNYQRLTNVTLRTATIQPQADAATMSILTETITEVEARMAARLRSIEEIVIEWRLTDE